MRFAVTRDAHCVEGPPGFCYRRAWGFTARHLQAKCPEISFLGRTPAIALQVTARPPIGLLNQAICGGNTTGERTPEARVLWPNMCLPKPQP